MPPRLLNRQKYDFERYGSHVIQNSYFFPIYFFEMVHVLCRTWTPIWKIYFELIPKDMSRALWTMWQWNLSRTRIFHYNN